VTDFISTYAEWVAISLVVALLIVPPLVHLWTGWALRRSEIVGQLSGRGIRLYFSQFHPAIRLRPDQPLWRTFQLYYGQSYGRRHYVYPLLLLALIGTFLLSLTIHRGFDYISGGGSSSGLPALASAAVAGAFLWVVLELVRRCHSRELSPFDINRATVRLTVAIPLGYAFTATFGDGAAWLALLLGALPLDTLSAYAGKIVNAKLNLGGDDAAQSELLSLDGITKEIAQRLQDVGVSTINQLARVDPIDLAIRANLEVSYITECVSQALAWDYFTKDNMGKAKRYFLRGAKEISDLVGDLTGTDQERRDASQRTLTLLAQDLGMEEAVLARALRAQVVEDPNAQFIYDMQNSNAVTDANASSITATPLEARANGQAAATISVTLRSADGRTVRGEEVNLTSTHNVDIVPQYAATNENGVATFNVTSRATGNVIFSAIDVMENILLTRKQAVSFT
jgi:hypothetical protein